MNYENAIQPSVKYSSTNPQIAQVDEGGNIIALSEGNTKIVVEANGKKAYISVKVQSLLIVKDLEVYLEKTQLNLDESAQINVNVTMNSQDVEQPQIEYILSIDEIFARHGFEFGVPELKGYFESKYWYNPDQYYKWDILDGVEEYNVQLIKKVEEGRTNKILKDQLQDFN